MIHKKTKTYQQQKATLKHIKNLPICRRQLCICQLEGILKKSVLFQRFKTIHDLETISGALLADNLIVLYCIWVHFVASPSGRTMELYLNVWCILSGWRMYEGPWTSAVLNCSTSSQCTRWNFRHPRFCWFVDFPFCSSLQHECTHTPVMALAVAAMIYKCSLPSWSCSCLSKCYY